MSAEVHGTYYFLCGRACQRIHSRRPPVVHAVRTSFPVTVAVATAASALLFAHVSTAPARSSSLPMLHAQVGLQSSPNTFSISLADAGGHTVSALSGGQYSVKVDDWASAHNFHLLGSHAGSLVATQIGGTTHTTLTVNLAPGTYTYQCDAHADSMVGSFAVFAADGSGTMTSNPVTVVHHSTGKTITLTYTVAAGGMSNGAVTLAVPTGWSAPSLTKTAAGYATTNKGKLAVAGRTLKVTGVTLPAAGKLVVTYGSKTGHGPGAAAPTTAVGKQTWTTAESSTAGGVAKPLAKSPVITIS
jgi:hypothetical protein